jgi:hypothetical protein
MPTPLSPHKASVITLVNFCKYLHRQLQQLGNEEVLDLWLA